MPSFNAVTLELLWSRLISIVDEAGAVISDATAKFDEGGFNYETRRRLAAGGAGDATPPAPSSSRARETSGSVADPFPRGDSLNRRFMRENPLLLVGARGTMAT